jgi:hypothetical protein
MESTPERKYRVQLDFSQQGFDELEALKEDLQASSRADTIRDALGMLYWTVQQLKNGGRILVKERNGEVNGVMFPFLPARYAAPPEDQVEVVDSNEQIQKERAAIIAALKTKASHGPRVR